MTFDPRARYQSASSYARRAKVRCTVMPTTWGIGSCGGRPCNRFSSQYATRQFGGGGGAKVVKARGGSSPVLAKLAVASLGLNRLIRRAYRRPMKPPGSE